MAKRKRERKVVSQSPASAPLADGYELVNLLTADHHFDRSVTVKTSDVMHRISVDGVTYYHVNDADDGTWQFCADGK